MPDLRAARDGTGVNITGAADIHVVMTPIYRFSGLPDLVHHSDFDADEEQPDKPRRDGRFAVTDDSGWLEVFVDVRAWVAVLREALPIWEARLAEIEAADAVAD